MDDDAIARKNICSHSKRRTYLGIGVQDLSNEQPRYYSSSPSYSFSLHLPDEIVGDRILTRSDKWELLRRAKMYLAARTVEDSDSLLGLDWRRRWNKENPSRAIRTVLDLFPSLKYAHESLLPLTARLRKKGLDTEFLKWKDSPWYRNSVCDSANAKNFSAGDVERFLRRPVVTADKELFMNEYVDIVASGKNGKLNVRLDNVCRSHSIWLDPIDSPKELFIWRLRVQKAINWAYANDCVPIMMTLTVFHRWQPLKELIHMLQSAWDKFFISGRTAVNRRKRMGCVGYVRRLEVTFNDGADFVDDNGEILHTLTNAGWHPHMHVILFVARDKFSDVSDMELQLRREWVAVVARYFQEEFGEEIEQSYIPSFERHGLYFSRYYRGPRAGQLREVHDSAYLDKIEGYDSTHIYAADDEVSADVVKNSKIPFDLLREITASNIDLWTEYAIATKGVSALRFSPPIIKQINDYFIAHPDEDPAPSNLPPSEVVAHLNASVYRLFYRNFLVPELRKKATEGYAALLDWMRDKFVELGVPAPYDAIADATAFPRPPNKISQCR